jgi:asparagine synthase (glutamine-hydrolysing)
MKLNATGAKIVLRSLLARYVPRELFERPKMGFGVPIAQWLRGPLREWAGAELEETRLQQDGYLDAKVVRSRWQQHLQGTRNWQRELWPILMFQSWLRAH